MMPRRRSLLWVLCLLGIMAWPGLAHAQGSHFEINMDGSTRKLSARGHIQLQEADGKISRTDAMNLTEDLRDAFVAYARRQKMRIDR
jgi:hypothetical protein